MEHNKAKIDLFKTYLNHLLVLIVGIGGGSFGMLTKHRDSILVGMGFTATVVAIVIYVIIATNVNKTLKDMQ